MEKKWKFVIFQQEMNWERTVGGEFGEDLRRVLRLREEIKESGKARDGKDRIWGFKVWKGFEEKGVEHGHEANRDWLERKVAILCFLFSQSC